VRRGFRQDNDSVVPNEATLRAVPDAGFHHWVDVLLTGFADSGIIRPSEQGPRTGRVVFHFSADVRMAVDPTRCRLWLVC
jgi:hypothetical protein